MSELTFTHEEESAKGLFQMIRDGEVVARMTYSRMDDHNIIIDHTAVDPKLKGTGTGKEIVFHAVAWARENDHKVLPLCPFAKAMIERYPELQDVLRK